MIVGAELRQWVSDRQSQRRNLAAVNHFATQWRLGPVHQHFTAAMAALTDTSAGAVAREVSILFADDSWVDSLLDSLTEEMRRDVYFDPPFRAINSDVHTGLIIFEDENVSIGAGISRVTQLAAKKNARRGAASIGFTGEVSVLKFVKAGGARLSLWEAPLITPEFSAERAGSCSPTGERNLKDGDVLIVDGRCESYVIEHACSNLLVLQAVIKRESSPVSVEYDAKTLAYVGCSATDDGASRIQMITTLLRKMECRAAFPTIAAFLDHRDFFVRWHVMRELLGIDAEAAMPHLRRMAASDPHADVRRAARAVLDRIAGDAGQRKEAA